MADVMVKYTGSFMYIFKSKPTAPYTTLCLHNSAFTFCIEVDT